MDVAGDLPDYPQRLHDAVIASVPQLIERTILLACERETVDKRDAVKAAMSHVQAETQTFVQEQLGVLLSTDVDEQRTNPLEVLRASTRFATAALRNAGVTAPVRDEFQQRLDPDDEYLIGPMSWMDLGDDVHEAGIEWGAWKAATVLTRRRAEGKLD